MARLFRSLGNPILVRPLSPPVERSTTREERVMLWRLRRCSGSVRRGYSSRPSVGLGRPSTICGCWTGTFGRARLRGEELTGFHSREAGARGSEERKLKLKIRFVWLQRAGWGRGSDCGANVRGGDDGVASLWDAVVAWAWASWDRPGMAVVVLVLEREAVGDAGGPGVQKRVGGIRRGIEPSKAHAPDAQDAASSADGQRAAGGQQRVLLLLWQYWQQWERRPSGNSVSISSGMRCSGCCCVKQRPRCVRRWLS
jgi:hypothetical protein